MEETELNMFSDAYFSQSDEADKTAVEVNKSRVACNCKKSFCLKKYCVCFAAGLPCDKELCACVNCGVDPDKNKTKSKYHIKKYVPKRDRYVAGMTTPEKRVKISADVKIHPKSGKMSLMNILVYDPIDPEKIDTNIFISSISDILLN